MLKRPLRKGVEKHEQLFFIWAYEQEKGHNQTLLKLAKLSWNHLQHMYQQELRSLTKWWIDLDFVTKLPFARDRLIEIYLYIVTKLTMLVSVIDDMYDVHGTIDELELFTSAIERWDTSMKNLPDYMRTCYDAIIDVLDEVDAITTKEGRPYCLEYAKEAVI
ncbi:unnamed protein product [Linum tenue]|uniref:Terpene synthase metal-binding domain-containing protein n=1 Tax=Linum tenue TaxID=586396 RepID=A0AAV0HVC7_9ROSI|nr:unnamed protein product [Linum tenue]